MEAFKPPKEQQKKYLHSTTKANWQGILDSNQEAQLSVGFTEIKI
jgi:endo-beta-N-acetylglucosaminidase D